MSTEKKSESLLTRSVVVYVVVYVVYVVYVVAVFMASNNSQRYRNRVEGLSGGIAGVLALVVTYPLIALNTRQHVRDKMSTSGETTTNSEGERKERQKKGEKPRVRALKKEEEEDDDDSWHYSLEKVKKAYVGVKPAAIGTVCSQGVYYYWFSFFNGEYLRMKERTTTREVHTLTPWESLITASLAGCMNVGLTLPIWTVVAKMQVASKTPKRRDIDAEDAESENEDGAHKWSAVKTKNNRKGREVVSRVNTRRRNEEKAKALGFWTVAKEVYDTSGVAGFYGGLSASLIMVANPALQFAFYETLRQKQQRSSSSSSSSSNNNSTISALEAFVLGATAKIGATLATYPMLVIKSRLQVGRREVLGTKKNTIKATTDDKNEGEKKEYDGIVDCMKDLYTNEGGFFAFYDGLTTKLSQTALCAALMFSSKEEISRRVDEMAMSILQRYGNSKTM